MTNGAPTVKFLYMDEKRPRGRFYPTEDGKDGEVLGPKEELTVLEAKDKKTSDDRSRIEELKRKLLEEAERERKEAEAERKRRQGVVSW